MRTLTIITALLLSCGAAHAGDLLPIIRGTATITDGDTIRPGPVSIRLEGIDAPEAGQQCFLGPSLIAGVFFLRDAVAYWPKWRSWVEGVGFIAMCSVAIAWLFNWPFRW